MSFEARIPEYRERIEEALDHWLPEAARPPRRLHEAMRYAVLGGGKRVRPLIVYATGEALGVDTSCLDAPAAAIELMHAFSLVHDDLPAMDNDNLRRGRPTTHLAFDEATAILAADAMQPLAFFILANDSALEKFPEIQARLVGILAEACGSNGMTGGQAIDIAAETQRLEAAEVEHMYRLKTGRLLRASVMMAAACAPATPTETVHALELFIDRIGLAFQIRDDILDVEGDTETIGKPQGSDEARHKSTYPAVVGLEPARRRATELLESGIAALQQLDERADGLRWLARYIVLRES